MKYLIFLALLTATTVLSAQQDTVRHQAFQDTTVTNPSKKGLWHRTKTDAFYTARVIGKTYGRPFHWKKNDWIKFGGIIAISGLTMFADESIDRFAVKHESDTFEAFASVGDFMGQPENNYPFMLAIWGSGVIANNDWLRDTGILLFASVTTSGLIQTFAKEAVGRSRPQSDRGAFVFKPFGGPDYHSFPSGHTMLALASSWILAKQINWLPAKIVFYGVPVLVGASRVYDRAHWFSDILLGSALGIACAETVHKIYFKLKEENNGNPKLSFMPTLNGMRITYKF